MSLLVQLLQVQQQQNSGLQSQLDSIKKRLGRPLEDSSPEQPLPMPLATTSMSPPIAPSIAPPMSPPIAPAPAALVTSQDLSASSMQSMNGDAILAKSGTDSVPAPQPAPSRAKASEVAQKVSQPERKSIPSTPVGKIAAADASQTPRLTSEALLQEVQAQNEQLVALMRSQVRFTLSQIPA